MYRLRESDLVPLGADQFGRTLLDKSAEIADLGFLGLRNGDGISKELSHDSLFPQNTINETYETSEIVKSAAWLDLHRQKGTNAK
jgi:hypothetical protein